MENNIELKDIADNLVIFNKDTIDKLFKLENCSDCISLYVFYYKTAKWQKTNQIKATDEYVMKSLKWGKTRLNNTKKTLKEHGLIETIKKVDNGHKFSGWYIKINYIITKKNINDIKPITEIEEKPVVSKPEVSISTNGFQNTNALKEIIKCLNKEIEMLKRENKEKSSSINTITCQQIVDLYHEICHSYPKLRSITSSREKHIKSRIKEYNDNIEVFKELFQKAEDSDFLKGKNDNKWRANFDWLINSTNMAKVLENNYENKKTKSKLPVWNRIEE